MTRRSKVSLVVAALFTVANVAGGVMAAMEGELLHTGLHAGLVLLGAYVVWRLAPSRYAGRIGRGGESVLSGPPDELNDRLTHLEQSVDAVAIEVERIGEGQRFMTRIFTEDGTTGARGEGSAEPIEGHAKI